MKSIILIGGICIVVLVLFNLDASRAQNTTNTTSDYSSTLSQSPKKVYITDLKYNITRRIRVTSPTTSSSSKSKSKNNSNRKLNAKRTQAKRNKSNRSNKRKSNARVVRG
ncbi:uncharacterized protein LOC108041342 [Drosophila rhopaloa]|uniref:Uncharacterized protein LOC108041342 n=1 Tax=Drosophila rhopaloa TaxID=1041015 RepID=A0A6P4EIB8_DRORH|nr:uncharacterized protein LOC108041342 [Drosophila rhopaloa]